MSDRLMETEALLNVLDAGSVAGGARRLGVTPSAASRLLARLEARLGVPLARRTTRSLRPTTEGLAFATEARAALERLDAAEAAAGGARAAPSGRLRVSAALSYGLSRVMPRLAAFRIAYPRIELDIALTDRVVDLAAEGIDVAVRVGPLRPVTGLRARLIEETRLLVVAAPAYLAARGLPAHPSHLRDHERLELSFARAQTAWLFVVGGRKVRIPTGAAVRTDGGEGLKALALAGVGMARLASFEVEGEIAAGRLVEVLAAFDPGDRLPVHALYAAEAGGATGRVRAFVDFLVGRPLPPS